MDPSAPSCPAARTSLSHFSSIQRQSHPGIAPSPQHTLPALFPGARAVPPFRPSSAPTTAFTQSLHPCSYRASTTFGSLLPPPPPPPLFRVLSTLGAPEPAYTRSARASLPARPHLCPGSARDRTTVPIDIWLPRTGLPVAKPSTHASLHARAPDTPQEPVGSHTPALSPVTRPL